MEIGGVIDLEGHLLQVVPTEHLLRRAVLGGPVVKHHPLQDLHIRIADPPAIVVMEPTILSPHQAVEEYVEE